MASVYVLYSLRDAKLYIGSTRGEADKRLNKHNRGNVKSTKARRPLKLLHKIHFDAYREAKKKELFFKTTTGRREIKSILKIKHGEMAE